MAGVPPRASPTCQEGSWSSDQTGHVAGRVAGPHPVVLHVPVEPAPGEDPRRVGRPAATAEDELRAGLHHAPGGPGPGRLPAAGEADRTEGVGEHAVVRAARVVGVLPDAGFVLVVEVGRPVGVRQHVGVAGGAAPLGQEAAADAASQLPGEVAQQLVRGAVHRPGHRPEPLVVHVGRGEGLGQDDDVGLVLPGCGPDQVGAALHVPLDLAHPQGGLDGRDLHAPVASVGGAHHTLSFTVSLTCADLTSPSSLRRSLRWGTAAGT
jgi:hypothetical protein